MKIIVFRGMKIRIENPAGSVRSGVDHDGNKWSIKMSHDYGEIIGTHGVDGDPIDVFIGNNPSSNFVFVIHQLNKETGSWDEDKCFLGFNDLRDAKAAYYKNFDKPDLFYGDIETIPLKVFKERIKQNDGSTMIHAADLLTIKKGDPVLVDGMHGRGVVVAEDGDDVIIRFWDGIYIRRNKSAVHRFEEGNYHNHYMSAGGIGSGRKPELGKGLNQWKTQEEEDRMARINPRQQSLFGPKHVEEIQKKVKEGKLSAASNSCPRCGSNKYSLMPTDFETAKCSKCGKNFQIKAAELIQSPDLDKVTVPTGPKKVIKKVGTLFCVVSEGTDRNFGCYNSKEQAEAVIRGDSFIAPNVPEGLFASSFGTMGPTLQPKIPKPHNAAGKGGGAEPFKPPHIKHVNLGHPQVIKVQKPKKIQAPKGVGSQHPNPSMKNGKGVGHRFPNPSEKVIESFGDMGEPMAGAMGHAHIEPEMWFHPPSLEKRGKVTRIPVDEPTEKDDKFLDVTKRKKAKKDMLNILKRGVPGGLPAQIPAQTTLISPHTASYQPMMGFSADRKFKFKNKKSDLVKDVPRHTTLFVPHTACYIKAGRTSDKRMRVSFKRQGCI